MRLFIMWLGLSCCFGGIAAAQTTPAGPLAGPDSASAAKPVVSKHRKPARTAHRAVPRSDGGQDQLPPVATPSLARVPEAPSDPVSFGMKWNGNNESARETRVQNYNGDAQGTGAEVGMKLHF